MVTASGSVFIEGLANLMADDVLEVIINLNCLSFWEVFFSFPDLHLFSFHWYIP